MNAGASQIEYLDDQTNTYTYYNMKKIISDNNWYIKDYEMVITVNGRQTQKAGGSSEYEVESPVQVSIDLDEFREKVLSLIMHILIYINRGDIYDR